MRRGITSETVGRKVPRCSVGLAYLAQIHHKHRPLSAWIRYRFNVAKLPLFPQLWCLSFCIEEYLCL